MPALSTTALDRARGGLAEFWRWWSGELKQLLPGHLALPGRRSAAADIRPYRDRIEIIRSVNGTGERLVERTPLDALEDDSWAEMAELTSEHDTRIVLASPLIHVLRLALPKAARPRLRTAIPLQLCDASPVDPAHLTWRIVDVLQQGEQLDVRVVIARTQLIDWFADSLLSHSGRIPAFYAEVDERQILLRPRRGRGFAISAPWIVAAGLLFSTPFCALLALSILVAAKRAQVAELEQSVGPKLAIERTIRDRYEAARALDGILRLPSISGLISDLAERLPDGATVHELALSEGGTLSMSVEGSDPDVLRTAFAGDPRLSGLHQMDQSATSHGTFLVRYRGKLR